MNVTDNSSLSDQIVRYIDKLQAVLFSTEPTAEEEFVTDEFISELLSKFPQIALMNDPDNYSYLPFTINMSCVENIHGFMHEFCHFIIATPHQRLLINFGLGISSKDNLNLPEPDIDTSIIDHHEQEFYAGLLTLVYQQYYGYDTWWCLETMGLNLEEEKDPLDDWYQALRDLTESGLIIWNENGVPVPSFQINEGKLNFNCHKFWVKNFHAMFV